MRAIWPRTLAALIAAACAHPAPSPSMLPSLQNGFSATPASFDFTSIAVPGAKRTVASGINDVGQIAGFYDDSAGATHGFLLRDGKFTTIDFPGAAFTVALGVGAHGEIVGTYRMSGEPAINFHGYLRTADGRYEHVDSPPHKNTIAQRILSDGTILGCRHDDDFGASMKGAVLRGPHASETDAVASMHNGATPDLRRIVGLYNYAPGERSKAYVIEDGKFTPLVVPGSTATTAWDVNPAGKVVGTYRDSAAVHGFILEREGFVTLDVPQSTMTRVFGINTSGAVVGSFDVGNKRYGFIATPRGNVATLQPRALFNGKDLSGWHADVPAADTNPRIPSPFIVRNGMLVSLGEPRGHLITDSTYRDYRLEVEYRFPGVPGNAGVLVHASTPRALYAMFPRSIEVQMEHGNAGDFWCIVEDVRVPDMERRRGPPEKWGTTEGKARRILNLTDNSEKPVGEWNTMVIEAVGRAIRVWVNSDLVNDGFDATADHGQIALQSEGSEVEFRKLTLTPITQLTPLRAQSP